MRPLFAMLALALLSATPVFAQSAEQLPPPRGPFAISSGSQNSMWRIDTATGAVSYCQRDLVSNDPALIRSRAPICSAWAR